MTRAGVVVALVLAAGACKQDEPASPAAAEHERLHATSAPAAIEAQAPRPRPAALTHVTLKALGMYCEESCPLRVRQALADLPEVYELGFDVSTESIFVSYDAALGAPKDVTGPMLAAIKAAGYDPWLSKEAWPDGATADVVTR